MRSNKGILQLFIGTFFIYIEKFYHILYIFEFDRILRVKPKGHRQENIYNVPFAY